MARCGCSSGTTCNCKVIAGANIVVSGVGSSGSPYVISGVTASVVPLDTTTVDMHVTGGPIYTVSADVIVSPDAGNGIVVHPNGLYAPAVCLSTDPGNEIVLGTDGCLYAPSITNGPGIAPIVGGVVAVCLSTDVGNSLVMGSDNCLFVAPGAVSCAAVAACFTTLDTTTVNLSPSGTLPLTADVIIDPSPTNLISTTTTNGLIAKLTTTTCGLLGDGSVANPLHVNTAGVWPYTCTPPSAFGSKVYCDPTSGVLLTDPPKGCVDASALRIAVAGTQNINTLFPGATGPYPLPATNFGPTFNLSVPNPSPCFPITITLFTGFSHFNMRMNNAGRGNVLTSMNITAVAGAALVTAIAPQYHNQWLRDENDAEADNTYDTQGITPQGTYLIPPGGTATFTAQAGMQITDYDAGMAITLRDLEMVMYATGCN